MRSGKYVVGSSLANILTCYSVFRVEPYSFCSFNCVYCYAKYVGRGQRFLTYDLDSLRKFIERFERLGLKPFFRMSTLVDPFQPIEKTEKRSLELLKFFNKYEVPVVINTKGNLLIQSPWVDEILRLAEKGLVVVQHTIPFKDEDAIKIEPFSPKPSERWSTAKVLGECGIPLAIRIQPLIPNVNGDPNYFRELVEEAKETKVRLIIIEMIRVMGRKNLKVYQKIFGDKIHKDQWERIGRSPWIKPGTGYYVNQLSVLQNIVTKAGLEFATCREALYHLHTAINCCGLHYLRPFIEQRLFLRPTLREYLLALKNIKLNLDSLHKIIELLKIKTLEKYDKELKDYIRSLKSTDIAIL